MTSKYFGRTRMKGLDKLGDVIIPGDEEFPRFSKTNFSNEVDRMLDHMYAEDRNGLGFLMGLIAFMPSFLVRWIVLLSEKNNAFPDFIGAPLRMIQFGLKGIILTLYYSNIEDDQGHGAAIISGLNWKTGISL